MSEVGVATNGEHSHPQLVARLARLFGQRGLARWVRACASQEYPLRSESGLKGTFSYQHSHGRFVPSQDDIRSSRL